HPRSVRLRQVDPARRPGRPPAARRRQPAGGWRADRRAVAGARHGVPAPHPAALAQRAGQRRLRPQDAGHRQGRAPPPGRRDAAPGRPAGLRRTLAQPALRRHAAARRDRPGADQPAAPAADGRAVRRAGRADPRAHAGAAAGHLDAHPHDGRVRHPRHRRGAVPRRPHPGDEPAPGALHRGPAPGLPAPAQCRPADQPRLRPPQAPLPGTAAPRGRPRTAAPDPAGPAHHRTSATANRPMTVPIADLTTDNPDILYLLPRLEAVDAGVRRIALIELADLEDPDGLPWLTDALVVDPAAEVRAEAARLLEAWEEPEVVQALCAALADAAEPVRLAAAQSLSELKSPEAGQLILPWVNHADAFVRSSALRALRELRLEDAAGPALLALGDREAAVRREAVGILGWPQPGGALAALA